MLPRQRSHISRPPSHKESRHAARVDLCAHLDRSDFAAAKDHIKESEKQNIYLTADLADWCQANACSLAVKQHLRTVRREFGIDLADVLVPRTTDDSREPGPRAPTKEFTLCVARELHRRVELGHPELAWRLVVELRKFDEEIELIDGEETGIEYGPLLESIFAQARYPGALPPARALHERLAEFGDRRS